jgi:uncharacterized membrane protein YuzA (DUF378 family)
LFRVHYRHAAKRRDVQGWIQVVDKGASAAERLSRPSLPSDEFSSEGTNTVKALNAVTLILVIVGGLNWGLVGAFNFDLVATIFGAGSMLSRIVYVLVGLAALWQVIPLVSSLSATEFPSTRTR